MVQGKLDPKGGHRLSYSFMSFCGRVLFSLTMFLLVLQACKAVEPLFYRMALAMPDVKFVEVPVQENNVNLHQGLGVPSLPYAHIYSPTAGLVEELRMVKGHFKTFHKIVETYREGQCTDLEMDPETGLFLSPFRLNNKVEWFQK